MIRQRHLTLDISANCRHLPRYFTALGILVLSIGCGTTTVTLRSGDNVPQGAPDARIRLLSGQATVGTSPFSPFTPANCQAAGNGPNPVVVPPAATTTGVARWVPSLNAAPQARWIATAPAPPAGGLVGGGAPGSTLYAMDFRVPCISYQNATLRSFVFAADNSLGDPATDLPTPANPVGVYVNCTPVPGFSDPNPPASSFGRQTQLGPATVQLNAGPNNLNTLYVYQRDQGGVAGVVFEAQFDLTRCVPPPTLSARASVDTAAECDRSGGTRSTVTIQVQGGLAPYTYSGPGQGIPPGPTAATSIQVTGLAPGTYTFTVTDSLSSPVTVPVTILPVVAAELQAVQPTEPGCDNGSITAVATGSAPPFTYRWNPPLTATTATVTDLEPGTYEVIVTDANGCFTVESTSIFCAP